MYIVRIVLIAIRLLAIERPIFRAISGMSTPPRVIFRRNQAIFRKNTRSIFSPIFSLTLFLAP